MTPPDTVPWEGMRGYGMGYPTKYTTPFRPVYVSTKDEKAIDSYRIIY